jgi:hypothetical protein
MTSKRLAGAAAIHGMPAVKQVDAKGAPSAGT